MVNIRNVPDESRVTPEKTMDDIILKSKPIEQMWIHVKDIFGANYLFPFKGVSLCEEAKDYWSLQFINVSSSPLVLRMPDYETGKNILQSVIRQNNSMTLRTYVLDLYEVTTKEG